VRHALQGFTALTVRVSTNIYVERLLQRFVHVVLDECQNVVPEGSPLPPSPPSLWLAV